MTLSIHVEKPFDRIQYSFMAKTLSRLGIEGNNLNLIKTICKNPTADIILNGEKIKSFPTKIQNEARMSSLINPFQYCTESSC